MKKSLWALCLFPCLCIGSLPALASDDLPFVGERLFAFDGDNAEQTITITADGTTTIKSHRGHGQIYVEYQGQYQTHMPYHQNGKIAGYYQIKDGAMYLLDINKKTVAECGRGYRFECIAELEEITTGN